MSCPFIVDVKGIVSMKGCTLTESKTEITANQPRKHYMLCPPSCYDGPYKKCSIYIERRDAK